MGDFVLRDSAVEHVVESHHLLEARHQQDTASNAALLEDVRHVSDTPLALHNSLRNVAAPLNKEVHQPFSTFSHWNLPDTLTVDMPIRRPQSTCKRHMRPIRRELHTTRFHARQKRLRVSARIPRARWKCFTASVVLIPNDQALTHE